MRKEIWVDDNVVGYIVGFKFDTGAGEQMLVKMSDFNNKRPALQTKLL